MAVPFLLVVFSHRSAAACQQRDLFRLGSAPVRELAFCPCICPVTPWVTSYLEKGNLVRFEKCVYLPAWNG
jgi:hypothetical protein